MFTMLLLIIVFIKLIRIKNILYIFEQLSIHTSHITFLQVNVYISQKNPKHNNFVFVYLNYLFNNK